MVGAPPRPIPEPPPPLPLPRRSLRSRVTGARRCSPKLRRLRRRHPAHGSRVRRGGRGRRGGESERNPAGAGGVEPCVLQRLVHAVIRTCPIARVIQTLQAIQAPADGGFGTPSPWMLRALKSEERAPPMRSKDTAATLWRGHTVVHVSRVEPDVAIQRDPRSPALPRGRARSTNLMRAPRAEATGLGGQSGARQGKAEGGMGWEGAIAKK